MSTTETKTSSTSAPTFPTFPTFASFGAFDPMAAWTKLATESFARMSAFADQYTATCAQLSQDALAYGFQLSTEARKLSVDAMKKFTVAA